FSRSGDCLKWVRGCPPMRRAERRPPFNTGHDVGSHSTNAASSSSKEACDGVPCETPTRAPQNTDHDYTPCALGRDRRGSEVKSVRNDRWRKDPIRSESLRRGSGWL